MGAWVILVCRECRKAEDTMMSVRGLARISEPLEEYIARRPEAVDYEELKPHVGHKGATLESDAHGQVSASDFDFDKNQFVVEYW